MEQFNSIYLKIKDEISKINILHDEYIKVYGGIKKFYEKYKIYVDTLEQERKNLLNKMKNFTINFKKLENPNLNLNNENININNNNINNINNNNIIEQNNGVIINNNIPPNNIEFLQNKRERPFPLLNNNMKNP